MTGYEIVTWFEDGIRRVVVMKRHEDDPDVWGVVRECQSVEAARVYLREVARRQAVLGEVR